MCVYAVAAPHLTVESTTYAVTTAQMISYRDKAPYREALVAAKTWRDQQQKEAQPGGTGSAAAAAVGVHEAAQVVEPLLASAGEAQQQGQAQEAASGQQQQQQQQQAVVQQQAVAGGVAEELAPGVVRSLSEVEPLPLEDPLSKVRRCLRNDQQ